MQPSTNEDLDELPHVIINSVDIGYRTVTDHLIDSENDTYHPTMDSMADEEYFASFDECTSMTGTYLH